MKENLPYWSATVLNTKAAGTAPWEVMNSSFSPSLFTPVAGTPWRGSGSRSTMRSSSIRVPSPFRAEPHTTGTMEQSFTPARRPCMISA